MELRQLRYFVAVAEAGNISTAAKKIFLTQPALSRQIKALEHEIGHCLLERRAHSVHLTRVGEGLLIEARELLQHAEQVLERVRTAGRGVRLRVGYAPSLASGTLMRTAWKLAVNRKHPFTNRQRITPDQMAREPLLAFCQRDYPEYWAIITGWLKEHRQHPTVAGEYDGAESLMTTVESGLGVAVVTARTAQLFHNRAQFKTLSPGPKRLCIAAGYRTDRGDHQPLAVFVEDLRIAAQALA